MANKTLRLSLSVLHAMFGSVRPSVRRPEPALNWPLDYNMRRLHVDLVHRVVVSRLLTKIGAILLPLSLPGVARRTRRVASFSEGGRIRWTRMELRQKCDERTDERTMHGASLEESLPLSFLLEMQSTSRMMISCATLPRSKWPE